MIKLFFNYLKKQTKKKIENKHIFFRIEAKVIKVIKPHGVGVCHNHEKF